VSGLTTAADVSLASDVARDMPEPAVLPVVITEAAARRRWGRSSASPA
jgi:hypothetical protein